MGNHTRPSIIPTQLLRSPTPGQLVGTHTESVNMVDSLSKQERSERMSRIKGKDTQPELIVRSLVHGMGYRYRLHGGRLPGKPDLVFRKRRKVIFVHGCFWHRHADCHLARLPKSRLDFWLPKLDANKARDEVVLKKLAAEGWQALTVWECELRDKDALANRIKDFLEESGNQE